MPNNENPSPKSPEERKLRFLLAQTLWRLQHDDLPAETDARKAAWEEVKKDEILKAARLIKMLENRGVMMTLQEANASEEA